MRLLRIGFAILSLTPTVAPAQGSEFTAEREVISIRGEALHRAYRVLGMFFRGERHPECYDVLFSDFHGNLRVDFVPRNQIAILYEGERNGEPAPCGRNVGYVLDSRGRILRRIYSR